MKRKLCIILSAVTVIFCAFTVVLLTKGKADGDSTHGNTLQNVYDESVSIPEPPENKGKVPAHIRWEPMLGCYIRNDVKYDPNTKSFIVPDEGLLSTADPDNENIRIDDWMAKNKNTKDKFLTSLVAYETKKETVLTDSSRYFPDKDDSVMKGIVPLGIPYLNDMMDMVMNQKLFDIPLTYAIGQITGTNCQPTGMFYDGYEQTHDQWRSNMKDLLGSVEKAVKSGEDLDKYGLLILPFLDQIDKTRAQKFQDKFADLLQRSGVMTSILSDPQWLANNGAVVSQLRRCIDTYK